MQRFLFIVLLGAVIVSSCKKTPGETTRIILHNATLTVDSLSMLWNGNAAVSSLAKGKTSGTLAEPYVALAAGTNNIILKSGSTVLLDKNAYGGVNTPYTLLVYDSTPSTTVSSLNFLFLTDVLTLADTVNARFRFINCVYAEVDSIVMRNATDTLNILNLGANPYFIGPTPSVLSVQAFVAIPPGIYQPLLFKDGQALPVAYDSVALGKEQIYSLIYSGVPGLTGPDSLRLSVIFHPIN
ncbi:MAG TPA: hypothetical protein VGM41_04920 [Chitinophagaceae bacterium]|jgi:hypothetical protein